MRAPWHSSRNPTTGDSGGEGGVEGESKEGGEEGCGYAKAEEVAVEAREEARARVDENTEATVIGAEVVDSGVRRRREEP